MATNDNKNNIIRLISGDRDTEPASTTLTGTVTITAASTTVVGVGTTFTTQLDAGAWLYYPTDNEIRQVKSVESDTQCTIKNAFTNPYAGATFRRIPKADCNRKEISWLILTGATALIDGVQVPIDTYDSVSTSGRERETARDFVDPIVFDTATVAGSILVRSKKA